MNDAGKIIVAALDAALAPSEKASNMITIGMIQSLEKQVGGSDRAASLYQAAGLDLSDPAERRRHRTMKKMAQILNAELRSSGAIASEKSLSAPPVAAPAAAPIAVPPPPHGTAARTASPATPNRETLLEIVESVFPLEAVGHCERMNDTALLQHVQKLAYQAGLKMPAPYGASDAKMESRGIFRTDPKAGGIARTMRADRQEKLDYILNITKL